MPRHQAKEWEKSYETLITEENVGGGVVPRSSRAIVTEQDYVMYNVVLFKKLVEDFKKEARARKFTVRDYKYDPKSVSDDKEVTKKQEKKRSKAKKDLIRWCRLNFAEAFVGWAHVKVIRLFVESVLRYGLPPEFATILIEPKKGAQKKLRNILGAIFKGLGSEILQQEDTSDVMIVVPGSNEKFYPYVFSKMAISIT